MHLCVWRRHLDLLPRAMGLKSSAFRDVSSVIFFLFFPFLLLCALAALLLSLLGSWVLPDGFFSCSPLLLFSVCARTSRDKRGAGFLRANDWNWQDTEVQFPDTPGLSDSRLHWPSIATPYQRMQSPPTPTVTQMEIPGLLKTPQSRD